MANVSVDELRAGMTPALYGWVVLGALTALAGLVVLLYPGPLALTDRLPVALLLLLPGGFGLYHAYAEATSPV